MINYQWNSVEIYPAQIAPSNIVDFTTLAVDFQFIFVQ